MISTDEQGDPVYEDIGPTPRFIELARRHRQRLGAQSPSDPAPLARPARAKPAKKPRRSA